MSRFAYVDVLLLHKVSAGDVFPDPFPRIPVVEIFLIEEEVKRDPASVYSQGFYDIKLHHSAVAIDEEIGVEKAV